MIGIIIAVATLSLTSTNDYVLTKSLMPTSNVNVIGVGMGKTNSYNVFRAEDPLFLREAFAERYLSVWGYDSPAYFISGMGIPIPREFSMATTNTSDGSALEFYAPESFDLPYWYVSRGNNNSFVDSTFELVPGAIGCDTNYNFVIAGINNPTQDCRISYLPYMRGYNRLTFDPSVMNTIARGAFRASVINAGYYVIEKLGNVITTSPVNTLARPNTYYYRGHSYYDKDRTYWSAEFNTATKTYTRPDGTQVRYAYNTNVKRLNESTFEDSTETTDVYPLIKKARYAEVVYEVPYYAISDTYFTPYVESGTLNVTVAGSAYKLHEYEDHISTGTYGPNFATLNLITNKNDATILKSYLIGGFRYKMTVKKSIDNGLGTGSSTNIVSCNQCCVVVKSAPCFWRQNVGGFPGYEMATTVKQMLSDAETYISPSWNEGVLPSAYTPQPSDFPQTIQNNHPVTSGTLQATHRHEHELTCEWLRVLFVFRRTNFRATFTE